MSIMLYFNEPIKYLFTLKTVFPNIEEKVNRNTQVSVNSTWFQMNYGNIWSKTLHSRGNIKLILSRARGRDSTQWMVAYLQQMSLCDGSGNEEDN